MKKILALIIAFIFIVIFFLIPIFGGEHFCYFPWVEDKGPGTIGCFYSDGGKGSTDPWHKDK